jgi:hypothetical protein
MNRILLGAEIAALLFLCACAAPPVVPYDRSAAQTNKKIGLLKPGWPSGPVSFLATDPGRSFGLIGALVDAGMQSGRDTDLIALLADQHVEADKLFVSDLTTALEKEGYTVVMIPADNRTTYLKKYPAATANDVDSYLDIAVPTYGYMAAGISKDAPYRPWLAAAVKLIKASDGTTLMQDSVTYNSLNIMGNTVGNSVTISPDPTYAFSAWSDATADKQKAAAGVSDAVDKSAAAIADLLK